MTKIIDREYFTLKIEVLNNVAHFHLKFKKFSPSYMKLAIKDFKNIAIPAAKDLGCSRILVSFNETLGDGNVEKWKKFIKCFGFDEPITAYYSIMEI